MLGESVRRMSSRTHGLLCISIYATGANADSNEACGATEQTVDLYHRCTRVPSIPVTAEVEMSTRIEAVVRAIGITILVAALTIPSTSRARECQIVSSTTSTPGNAALHALPQ